MSLHTQLKRDLRAYKTKEKLVAFGKMLPLELRSKPPKEDFVKKWLHCKKVPRKLATMEAVWGGIEGLRFIYLLTFFKNLYSFVKERCHSNFIYIKMLELP